MAACLPPMIISRANFSLHCANIERANRAEVCKYRAVALTIGKSLKADQTDVTLHPEGRAPFAAPIRSVRMKSEAEATVEPVPMPPRLAVDVRGVSLTFETGDGKVDALSNVSLQVAEGEFVSFIGPSGCGKTTM